VPNRSAPSPIISLLGPAMVAGVAYLDPGNVASNITGGSQFGYLLIWVVVMGNLIAWVVQYLSAQLGIVTGLSLPEVMGKRIQSRTGRLAYWVQGELVAMATDVAEVIGGAVALYLLFDLPLWLGGLIVGAVSIGLLGVQSRFGPKPFERVIALFIVVIAIGFTASLFVHPVDGWAVVGGLVPRLEGSGSLLLAAAILGATVMPHAIYAHSAFSRDRFPSATGADIPRLLRATRIDVTVALAIAGAVNIALLVVGAAVLGDNPESETLDRGIFRPQRRARYRDSDSVRGGAARLIPCVDRRRCIRGCRNHVGADELLCRSHRASRDHRDPSPRPPHRGGRADLRAHRQPSDLEFWDSVRSRPAHPRHGHKATHGGAPRSLSGEDPRGNRHRRRDCHQRRIDCSNAWSLIQPRLSVAL
jgi:hypothetical protein